jgi:putative Mn2+ efflux pump MntP
MIMGIFELFILAVGLSMDACAVSVCKGLSVRRVEPKHMLLCGAYFGGFQALMPLIGYLLGVNFQSLITSIDHWIAFVLLGLIGMNMIRESRSCDEDEHGDDFGFKTMVLMAIATSIDALAVGISFAFLRVAIIRAVVLIGCTTCLLSAAGVRLGRSVGSRFHEKAEIAGGVILILIGTHVLLQHLGVMPF